MQTLDKCYLEYSAITSARTKRECEASNLILFAYKEIMKKDICSITPADEQILRSYETWFIEFYGEAKFEATCKQLNLPWRAPK